MVADLLLPLQVDTEATKLKRLLAAIKASSPTAGKLSLDTAPRALVPPTSKAAVAQEVAAMVDLRIK